MWLLNGPCLENRKHDVCLLQMYFKTVETQLLIH